jgi:phosphatidylserine/phosphatidylglycerophosphate/cardiolipin synthase-like enzyme
MPPTITDLEDKYFDPALGLTRYYGNVEVIPHVDGIAYFNAIADALDTCQGPGDKIYITAWVFAPYFSLRQPTGISVSPAGPNLDELLVDKAKRGADVRIVLGAPYFSSGTEGLPPYNIIWSVNRLVEKFDIAGGIRSVFNNNVYVARDLRSADRGGVQPLRGRVLLDWGGRTPDSRHDKSTVIFSAATGQLRAFVGGIDFDSGRISDPQHTPPHSDEMPSWHDAGLELFGNAAEGVLDNFITRWVETATLPPESLSYGGAVELFNPVIESAQPTHASGAGHPISSSGPSVRILRSYDSIRALRIWLNTPNLAWHSLPGGVYEVLRVLSRAINRAQNYIYIECQTLNPSAGIDITYYLHSKLYPLLSAACARGVKVILVCYDAGTPRMSPEIEIEILQPLTSAQRDNFGLYWVEDCRLHSKIVLVDDEFSCIGSANMWDRSMNGTESELSAAYVHTGESNSQVADLRVRLWAEHLRVPIADATARAELRDLAIGLGVFRPNWGTRSLSFPTPNKKLREISA